MFQLKNWFLQIHNDAVTGHGKCYGNPKFPEGKRIHTSRLSEITVDDEQNCLKLFTQSGSCYYLDFAEINDSKLQFTQAAAEQMNIHLDIAKCLELKSRKTEILKKRLTGILNPCELYVEMAGSLDTCEAYYKTADGIVTAIPIVLHMGDFTNSVLIMNMQCDWRFFPHERHIECYQWADKPHAVRLHNTGSDFIYKDGLRNILCRRGETAVISKDASSDAPLVFSEFIC